MTSIIQAEVTFITSTSQIAAHQRGGLLHRHGKTTVCNVAETEAAETEAMTY